ncbi:pyruvate dehydrogenase (acetyl-transferring), homodimeric type, partial [Streptomyces sp. NPDC056159]
RKCTAPGRRYRPWPGATRPHPRPARRVHPVAPLPAPADKAFAAFDKGSGSQSVATTMAFVRLVKDLVRDKETGKRWVPIVPDEARTFGMESLFPSLGIYSPKGQTYEPVDRDQLMYYKEAKNGQILNEGITEAGSMADFIAASSSYSTHGEAMIPFYIFYSMFGWQRTADQMWQLGDQLGRGFLVGATAGRTTLTGEGLQHADGHSPVIAATNPAALTYDPAFAYEVAAIVKEGLRRMYGQAEPGEDQDVFYYLTVYNEPLPQPAKPSVPGVDEGIVKGLYRFNTAESAGLTVPANAPRIQLLGSGTAIHWALDAQRMLAEEWGVAADVWSATSWGELRRDAMEADAALLRGEERVPYVRRALQGAEGPVLAVSDYMRQVPDQVAQWIEQDYTSLGADGFGLSDTRDAARRHFGVDGQSIVAAALAQLARRGEVKASAVKEAREKYGL